MIKFMKELIMRNTGWKLFSLIIAIILWCVIINIENPAETKPFSVPVTFSGDTALESQNLVWSNKSVYKDYKVVVKVRGNRLALEELNKRSQEIKATVNLNSEMLYNMQMSEVNKVLVNPVLPTLDSSNGNCEIILTVPQYIDVILEKLETTQKEITVLPTGEPADGFVTLESEVIPASIQIKGAKSNIDKINSVRVNVDITGASSNINTIATPKAYDANGKEISDLTILTEQVEVNIPVNKYKKIALDASSNQGIPADGYVLKDIQCEPQYIEIVGSNEDIDKIKDLKLPIFNLSGLSETTTNIYDLKSILPENVSIRKGSAKEAKVTAFIVKEGTKEFIIPTKDITIKGFDSSKVKYIVEQESIILNLKGLDSIINSISINDIVAEADISNYDLGSHKVNIRFTLPDGVTMVNDNISMDIIISNITDNETQTSTQTQTQENDNENPINETNVDNS